MEKNLSRHHNLKRERQLRGWSQADVAGRIGSDPKTVGRWERGLGFPSPYFQQRLVDLFGKDAMELGFLAEEEENRGEILPEGQVTSKDNHTPALRPDWGEAPHIEGFYGREKELIQLQQWMIDDRCRMIAIIGLGGVGKTTLAMKAAMQASDMFDYVFWRSLQHSPPVEGIVQNCLHFVFQQQHIDMPNELDEQLSLLIDRLRQHRCLLILDNIESVLQGNHATGRYREGYEGYSKLFGRIGESYHQSCLLLTCREKPGEIAQMEGMASPVRSLSLAGIAPVDVQKLLEDRGLFGTEEAWSNLVQRYSGNPLALKLVCEPIHQVFDGDIARFLRESGAVFGGIRVLLEQQFQRLSPLEQEIMYWLALEREPVAFHEIREDLAYPLQGTALVEALDSLRRRSMIETSGNSRFSLQPVVMEYVTERFVEQIAEEVDAETVALFGSHALIKAQGKDYIRDSQRHLILKPVAEKLLFTLGLKESENKLKRILFGLHAPHLSKASYAAGNVLNLLVQLHINLRGTDFSHLVVRQAYLQGVHLPEVNFTHADLATSLFTDTFGGILCVALSPDANLLAAGTTNGEIRVWQTASHLALRICRGHTDGVRSIAFSPDSQLLVSGSEDQQVRIWEANTGHCLSNLQGHTNVVRSVAFSPDGHLVASGSEDQTIRLWETNTGRCLAVLQGHTHWIRSIAFSPDGSVLISGSDDATIRVWDINTGQCLTILQGHANRVRSVAFSADGNTIASSGDDQTVRLWSAQTGNCLSVLQGHLYPVRSVAFSPDKEMLASGGDDQTIRIWEVSTGRCLRVLRDHTNRVWSVTFSPDSQFLVSGSEDQTIRFWDVDTGHCLSTLQGYSRSIWSIAYHPDGKILASGGEDQSIRLWDTRTAHCFNILQGHSHRVRIVTYSPDGRILASGSDDQTIRLWEPETGRCLSILRGHTHLVKALAFSPHGNILASGSYDSTIRLWEVSTARCLATFSGSNNLIHVVAFSPDGRLVASGNEDQTIGLWEVSTGHHLSILRGHAHRVSSLAFSSSGDVIASGSDDATIRLWEVSTGRCLSILYGHSQWVRAIAFSPDGSTLASGSHDATIRLWEVSTSRCLATLQGNESTIRSLAFSPDGRYIASSSDNGSMKLWDVQTGECLTTLRSERPYEHMNITGIKGITEAQKTTLKALGAIEDEETFHTHSE